METAVLEKTPPADIGPSRRRPVNRARLIQRLQWNSGYALAAPYVIHLLIFFGYPLLFSIVLVFHRWDIVTPMEFIGFNNFIRLFQDDLFFRAILNTGVFLAVHIPLQLAIAVFLAELLNKRIFARGIFRTIYFLPVVVSGVVVTILFQQIFAFDTGLLNNIITSIGGSRVPWLSSPDLAMPSIAVLATWKNVGLYVVLFLAGLQNIPQALYEVTEIEGAGAWQTWWHVTLPLLNPTVTTVIILSTIGGFSLFIEPYVLTGGGPLNSTLSALLYIYNQAFYFNHMGYAAALGLCFALLILIVVFIQRRFVEREIY